VNDRSLYPSGIISWSVHGGKVNLSCTLGILDVTFAWDASSLHFLGFSSLENIKLYYQIQALKIPISLTPAYYILGQ